MEAQAAEPWVPQSGDCLEYRGSNRDGVIAGLKIDPNWKEHPPKQLWRQKLGPGWSDMIVVDGHLVTQEQRGPSEAVVCYDAASGKELWSHLDPVRFEESLAGAGPRSTPTFSDGRIYTFGTRARSIASRPRPALSSGRTTRRKMLKSRPRTSRNGATRYRHSSSTAS